MQLLKIRGFSEFFTDSFQFIKINAVHFFTNYFIINGLFLIFYFGFNYYNSKAFDLPWYFVVLGAILLIFFYIINFSFVPIYMILYQEKGTQFNHNDILKYMSQNAGKILIFVLITLLMSIPIFIAFYISAILVAITIVGILFLPLLFAAFFLWFQMTYYEYLYSNKNYFDCMGYGFTLFTKKFWATTASTALLYTIIMVVYFLALGFTGFFSSLLEINFTDPESIAGIETVFKSPVVLIIATAVMVLYALINISQGIIYFSQKELLEGIQTKLNIDDIGKNEL